MFPIALTMFLARDGFSAIIRIEVKLRSEKESINIKTTEIIDYIKKKVKEETEK